MKPHFLWLLLAIGPCFAFGQTKVTRTYPINKGQSVSVKFDYPKLIRVSSWAGNEIVVEATININEGENNEAFQLLDTASAGWISIRGTVDMKSIPESYYVVANGSKIRFTTKQDLQAYIADKKDEIRSNYQTKDVDISIDIKIPEGVSTELVSVYGTVELLNCNMPILVDAKYGNVDASVRAKNTGQVKLTTRYGKIYTNLDLKPTEQIDKNFFTSITATPGTGPKYELSAPYGNIYLRNAL